MPSNVRGYHVYSEPTLPDDENPKSSLKKKLQTVTKHGILEELVPTRGTLNAIGNFMRQTSQQPEKIFKSTAEFLKNQNNQSGAAGLMTQFVGSANENLYHNMNSSLPILPTLAQDPNISNADVGGKHQHPNQSLHVGGRRSSQNRRRSNASTSSLHHNVPLGSSAGHMPGKRASIRPGVNFKSLVKNSKPDFERVPVHLKLEPVKPFSGTWSEFNKRISKKYNPAIKERDDKWDTNKGDVVNCIKLNLDILNKNKRLMNNIDTVSAITGLRRNFPSGKVFKDRPHTFVPNDAHIKLTAAGYARNPAGKPYFS